MKIILSLQYLNVHLEQGNKREMTEYPVKIEQLRPGMFVRIVGLGWRDHPFLMNSFKIKNNEQIEVISQCGVATVIFVPEKSDVLPLAVQKNLPPTPAVSVSDPKKDAEMERLWEEKNERIANQKTLRKKINACQKKFSSSVETVRNVMKNIEGGRLESVENAEDLLQTIIDDLVAEKETALQLMNVDKVGDGIFYHSLNVSVLSMMLGRELGLDAEELKIIGMGALFHDVGKHRVPKNVLYKPTPLTKFEREILQMHPQYGVETMMPLAADCRFSLDAVRIIKEHHERGDGSGYPNRLKGEDISEMTKIVSIVDRYDNLCNNQNPEKSITPHEAMAYMFKSERAYLDTKFLQRFISYMGIYPPGTIVRLSNEVVGMVISVNTSNSLKPNLLIYDPEISKNEALIFDLSEDPSLSITTSIRPRDLPDAVYDYLNPRVRVSYYLSAQDLQPAKPGVTGK